MKLSKALSVLLPLTLTLAACGALAPSGPDGDDAGTAADVVAPSGPDGDDAGTAADVVAPLPDAGASTTEAGATDDAAPSVPDVYELPPHCEGLYPIAYSCFPGQGGECTECINGRQCCVQ